MMFLTRFWRSLTKKDSVESAKYEINKFSTCTYSFKLLRTFFSWTWIRSGFFRIGSGFLRIGYGFLRIGSGLRKKSWIRKKTRIRNTGKKHILLRRKYPVFRIHIWFVFDGMVILHIEIFHFHFQICPIITVHIPVGRYQSTTDGRTVLVLRSHLFGFLGT